MNWSLKALIAFILYGIVLVLVIMLLSALLGAGPARAAGPHPGCKPYKVSSYSPTGIVGCIVYGTGIASWYHGNGVARNDCVYPWTKCQPISITSLDTGITITVTPKMYCDCYTGTSKQRLVDLTPATLKALGLNPSQGLFRVTVQPAGTSLPDTAMEQP